LSDNSAHNGGGGGVYNDGTLTVGNSTLSDNSPTGGGGGINNIGSLVLVNSTLSGNSTTRFGGGILCTEGTSDVRITNSTLTGNGGDSDNDSDGSGGGYFFTGAGGSLTLNNSIVAGNFRGAGAGPTADDIGIQGSDHQVSGS